MVQLRVLSGRRAGTVFQPRRLPCSIGRAANSDLALDDAGVWEQHLQLDVQREAGVLLRLLSPALATVNGEPFEQLTLRNGDLIEAGGVQLRFELSAACQKSLLPRELLTWLAIAGVCLLQVGILYWLLR